MMVHAMCNALLYLSTTHAYHSVQKGSTLLRVNACPVLRDVKSVGMRILVLCVVKDTKHIIVNVFQSAQQKHMSWE